MPVTLPDATLLATDEITILRGGVEYVVSGAALIAAMPVPTVPTPVAPTTVTSLTSGAMIQVIDNNKPVQINVVTLLASAAVMPATAPLQGVSTPMTSG